MARSSRGSCGRRSLIEVNDTSREMRRDLAPITRTGWVLQSCHVDQVANGFGHGRVEMWAQDGTMLGTVSQTSVLRSVDKLV